MRLCDSNVWLALSLSGHQHHTAARNWFGAIDEPSSVLFCRATQQTFLRLLTSAAVLGVYGNAPLSNRQAWAAWEALVADDRIALRAAEPAGLPELWKRLAVRNSASAKLWMDAYLAAFAISAECRLATLDSAFERFAGLDVELVG